MSDPYASPEMIRRITRRKYRPAQRRKLDELGIPYILGAGDEPLVLLRNLPDHGTRDHHNHEPRFDRL